MQNGILSKFGGITKPYKGLFPYKVLTLWGYFNLLNQNYAFIKKETIARARVCYEKELLYEAVRLGIGVLMVY